MSDPVRLSDIELLPADSWDRYPRVRIGMRDEIPHHVRLAIWCRDHGQCDICRAGEWTANKWQLDHIMPWSAGGSDDSTNLRVLCGRCNQERSNYRDPFARRRTPVTWWCTNCFTEDHQWLDAQTLGRLPLCPTHKMQDHCRVHRDYVRHFKETGEWPAWFQREPISEEVSLVWAYCAHCNAYGWTDRPL